MTGATLFSGIHAPECAGPDIDWRFCAEIESFPAAVGAARHPHIPNLGDVTAPDFIQRAKETLHGSTLDVLVFGSPCQGFSVAGKRLGLDDPRSNLALHALRIVRELAPTFFVFENVPGLFSSYSGAPASPTALEIERAGGSIVREFIESSDFAEFLQWVQDIRYFGAWTVLDAQFAGLAQRRERVFFVGNSRDWRYSAAIFLDSESLCGDPPTREKARQGIAPATEGGAGVSGEIPALIERERERESSMRRNRADLKHGVGRTRTGEHRPGMGQREGRSFCDDLSPALTGSGRGVERTGESRGQDPVIAVFET